MSRKKVALLNTDISLIKNTANSIVLTVIVCCYTGGNGCTLYSTYLAIRADVSLGTEYSECFTSWGERGDVARGDQMTSSSVYDGRVAVYGAAVGIDGVACVNNFEYLFATKAEDPAYLQVDLQVPMKISHIIVVLRLASGFSVVKIFLGNTSSDFTSHAVYFFHFSPENDKTSYVIKGDTTIEGRYLTFYRPISGNTPMGLYDMQIIPA